METDKEKLTLKEIVGYLPFETKVLRLCNNEVLLLHGISGKNTIEATKIVLEIEYSALLAFGYTDISDDEEFKLILRPLSDLTKVITHNGETFVPIVELAKINLTKNNIAKHSWKVGQGIFSAYSPSYEVLFQFHDLGFYCKYKGSLRPVLDQLELFEKLYEWHFDIYNLIERKLAVNLNDLPNE